MSTRSVNQKVGDWHAAYTAIRDEMLMDLKRVPPHAISSSLVPAIHRTAAIAAATLVAVGTGPARPVWNIEEEDDGDPLV